MGKGKKGMKGQEGIGFSYFGYVLKGALDPLSGRSDGRGRGKVRVGQAWVGVHACGRARGCESVLARVMYLLSISKGKGWKWSMKLISKDEILM